MRWYYPEQHDIGELCVAKRWWSELVLTSRETDDGDVDAVVLFKSTDFELSMRGDCIGHNDFFVDLIVDMVYHLVLSYYESMIGDDNFVD